MAASEPVTTTKTLRPDPSEFQSGDFVWPKKPGVIVPYSAAYAPDMRQVPTDFYDRQKFETEKRAYLEQVAKSDRDFTASREDRFNRLSFEAFAKQYQGSQTLNVESLGTGSIVYVGHVAILEIWDGKPFVIEAVPNKAMLGLLHRLVQLAFDDRRQMLGTPLQPLYRYKWPLRRFHHGLDVVGLVPMRLR